MENKQLTLGSLFDGSGGFPLGGLLTGQITPLWSSEVEPFAIRVTTKRLPWVRHYGDVSAISGADLPPVDIITFGSPCQDMSIAGMEALKGRDCYGGLDLSSTGDITAFVLMFPPRVPEEKYIMLPFFWIPEDTIPQRVRRASVPYDVWYQQGYLMATEGNVIHYGFIEKVIEELGKTYHILEIAFDRWGAVQMTQNLEGMGFTVVPFGQGFKDMSPPTKEFYKLLMEGRIIHGGNPVMAWMAGNVVVDTDPAGNIKPTKAKSPEKIDGIVAAIMALDRCIRNEGQQQGSVYDERDMIVF